MNITSERVAKIRWHCRRGMLELDLLLNRFLAKGFKLLSNEEVNLFEDLLTFNDPELYAYLSNHQKFESINDEINNNDDNYNQKLANLIDFIKLHNQI